MLQNIECFKLICISIFSVQKTMPRFTVGYDNNLVIDNIIFCINQSPVFCLPIKGCQMISFTSLFFWVSFKYLKTY